MGLFKSKIEKELEKKRLIKRTVYNMNKQIDALEEQKKVFVQKAVEAKKNGWKHSTTWRSRAIK